MPLSTVLAIPARLVCWLLLRGASLSLLASLAFADGTPQEEAFLRVPGAHELTQQDRSFALARLPAPLVAAMEPHDWGTEDGNLPPEIQGFTYDLNRDGRDEYFIYNRVYSGSGGSYYLVFGEINGEWRPILEFQGSLHIFPSRGRWPRIASISRGGGSTWSKTYREFRDGQYRDTAYESYERGVVTKQVPPQVEDSQ